MEIIAHTTTFELAAGMAAFVAGVCIGPWLLHAVYKWWLWAGRS